MPDETKSPAEVVTEAAKHANESTVVSRDPEKDTSCEENKSIPRGFKNNEEYDRCMGDLEKTLKKEGVSDAKIGVRGSSITGQSSKGGPFRIQASGGKPPSDVDVFVESGQLTRGIPGGKSNPDFIHPDKLMQKYPSLKEWSDTWSNELGREITPGGFRSGSVPPGPKVFWGGN